jgi:hypothetical protein
MSNLSLRRSFVLFHLTLAIVIFIQSVKTAIMVSHGQILNPLGSHLTILASIEAVAALLFLIPKTLKYASGILLAIFVFVFIIHGVQQELDLLVYAAGVLFVRVHGSTFSKDLFFTHYTAA